MSKRSKPIIVTKKSPVSLIDVYTPSAGLLDKIGFILFHLDEAAVRVVAILTGARSAGSLTIRKCRIGSR